MSSFQVPDGTIDSHVHARENLVVGVDIGGTNLRLALADVAGAILGHWSSSTVGIRDPQTIVRLIREGVDTLLLQFASRRSQLVGIGVGAPGITDTDQGIVLATSYLMGWSNVPLRDLLQEALAIPVFVDNDVNMAAFGEYSAGSAQAVGNFTFLAIGTGVGAGIMLDGQVFRGEGWLAGEIGYMLVPGVSTDPIEGDNPGALEEIIGGEGTRKRWQSLWSEGLSRLGKDATATQIFDEATKGDSLAQTVLEVSARTLAYAIYNLSLILNCPLFVLGGGVGVHPALVQATDDFVKGLNARVQPRLVVSSLGREAQIVGAVFRAIEISKQCKRTSV